MSQLSETLSDDLYHLVCGSEIGRGTYRTVYNTVLNPDWVVKRDTGENYSNIMEWQIYDEFKNNPLARWLAPVYYMSPRGLWLVQAKTEPLQRGQMPDRVPALFADTKPENWGMLNGKPVCHDYGNNRVFDLAGKHGKKLRKVTFS